MVGYVPARKVRHHATMILVVAAAVLVGLPGLIGACHIGLLAVASWFYREPSPTERHEVRFLILVPAHNEEQVIHDGLASILSDRRAHDQVLVVADRCTDRTTDIARSLGARVLDVAPMRSPVAQPRDRRVSSTRAVGLGRGADARCRLGDRTRVLRGV